LIIGVKARGGGRGVISLGNGRPSDPARLRRRSRWFNLTIAMIGHPLGIFG